MELMHKDMFLFFYLACSLNTGETLCNKPHAISVLLLNDTNSLIDIYFDGFL